LCGTDGWRRIEVELSSAVLGDRRAGNVTGRGQQRSFRVAQVEHVELARERGIVALGRGGGIRSGAHAHEIAEHLPPMGFLTGVVRRGIAPCRRQLRRIGAQRGQRRRGRSDVGAAEVRQAVDLGAYTLPHCGKSRILDRGQSSARR
jgi:hypothetical protein